MSSKSESGDSDSSESLFGDLVDNPYDAVDCLGLKAPPKLTDFEKSIKYKFTFDRNKYREYPDLRIYSLQSQHRYQNLKHLLKFPQIPPYNSIFCVFGRKYSGFRAERFLQRHLCLNHCCWDPTKCFLEDSHTGRLRDLTSKGFLEQYNPEFSAHFGNDKSTLRLNLDEDGHPKLFELIEELGISSKLEYDEDESAVSHEYVSDEFRNEERPLYIIEEKKVHDIIVALLEASKHSVEINKSDMRQIYQDSYNHTSVSSRPILSLMMWGPKSSINCASSQELCQLEEDSWNQLVTDGKYHNCSEFSDEHYWMFNHKGGFNCKNIEKIMLEGPAMTKELNTVYPCSENACLVDCFCKLCEHTTKLICQLKDHKRHMMRFDKDCLVQIQSQCQLHWVTHPENFEDDLDIFVEKNVFFHSGEVIQQPRSQAVGVVKFAGIRRSCAECRSNVYDHFRNHMVFHLQCKFCSFQLATLTDDQFWEKVCNDCGKVFDTKDAKKINWHRKVHQENEEFQCNQCESKFRRNFTLKRHRQECHGEQSDLDQVEEKIVNHFEAYADRTKQILREESKPPNEKVNKYRCVNCNRTFRLERYLTRHVGLNHKEIEKYECLECNKEFNHKKNLRIHESTAHSKDDPKFHKYLQETEEKYGCNLCKKQFGRKDCLKRHLRTHKESFPKHSCSQCGKEFKRKDFLKVHIATIHSQHGPEFSCHTCGKIFNRKSNMVRHMITFDHM